MLQVGSMMKGPCGCKWGMFVGGWEGAGRGRGGEAGGGGRGCSRSLRIHQITSAIYFP